VASVIIIIIIIIMTIGDVLVVNIVVSIYLHSGCQWWREVLLIPSQGEGEVLAWRLLYVL